MNVVDLIDEIDEVLPCLVAKIGQRLFLSLPPRYRVTDNIIPTLEILLELCARHEHNKEFVTPEAQQALMEDILRIGKDLENNPDDITASYLVDEAVRDRITILTT